MQYGGSFVKASTTVGKVTISGSTFVGAVPSPTWNRRGAAISFGDDDDYAFTAGILVRDNVFRNYYLPSSSRSLIWARQASNGGNMLEIRSNVFRNIT